MEKKPLLLKDYSSNSNKSKKQEIKERPRAEKVIKGTAKVKKKSELHKLANIFISEDVPNVKEYIINDVIVPAIRKTLWDIVTSSADMFFGNGKSNKTFRSNTVSYRDYNSISTSRRVSDDRDHKATFEYDDITLETKDEAAAILEQMDEMIDQYGVVSVLDYYDLAGVTMDNTSANYGWTDIRSARVIRTRDGYVIKFPKARPINE